MKNKRYNVLKIAVIFTLLAILSGIIYIASNNTKIINGKEKINPMAQDGDITWDVSATTSDHVIATLSPNGTLTISGSGKMKNFSNKIGAPWKEQYKASIKKVIVNEGVKCIGWYAFDECNLLTSIIIPPGLMSIERFAFYDCSSLTSINIPSSVVNIGEWAFGGCSSLTGIQIPEGLTIIEDSTFDGCSSLTNIQIPSSITSIERLAFYDCSSLTSINIPSSVVNIGECAFEECSSLTSIQIPQGVTIIEERTFEGCSSLTNIQIPSGVTSIGERAFNRCSGLTSIKIPSGVTSIKGSTFKRCSSLSSIEIPEGVTAIGDYAFYNCSNLTKIEIPEGVTTIGDEVFYGCSSLTSIQIQQGIMNVGDSMFCGCKNLMSIQISESVTNIGNYAFCSCNSLTSIKIPSGVTNIGECAFSGCSSLTSIKIPSGVTSIETYTFKDCKNLISIEIPSGVTSIRERAFEGCNSLTSIQIPSGITSIEGYTFEGCSSLTSIKIPESVTNIGDGAFWRCHSLVSLQIPSAVTSIGDRAFEGCSGLTSIKIPEGVTSIDVFVFCHCTNLKNVKLPNSIHSVCKNAFYECSPLIEIDADPECGYQIEGWYENEEFTGVKLENLPVNSNEGKMLYAKWAPIEYTITYDLEGGSLPQGKSNPTTYTIETENFTLNNPTKTGYTFTGWTGSNGSTKQTQVTISKGSTENKEYTANWKANTYTITYNGNGATGGSTEKSTHEYDKEKALTVNGFTKSYTITYNHNYQGSQNETREYSVAFSKWNTTEDGTGTNYEDKQSVKNLTAKNGENINLYAQWENTSGEVTYVPERTGYTFAGWYTNSELTGERVDKSKAGSYTPTSSITLYAKWTPIEYTITYDLAGGSLPQGKNNPTTYTIETENFTLNNPVKTGYTFTGWTESNSQTPEITVTIEKGSTGNKDYTANWEKKVELQITIDSKYEIKEEDGVKYLTNIEPNTTIEALLWNQETRKIETNGEIKVYKENKEIDYLADGVGTPLLGTGYRIEITLEDKKQEYISVVKGDLTGNGKIDQGDLLMLAKYKVGKLKEDAEDETQRITKESILASDLNSNGSNSDQGDLLMIAKILVGKLD